MAYNPTTWKDGDVITAVKMNKLEQGVKDAGGGGILWRCILQRAHRLRNTPGGRLYRRAGWCAAQYLDAYRRRHRRCYPV